VFVTVAHLNCSLEEANMGFAYVTLRATTSVIRIQWGERIKILKFWTYCETVKFTWDHSDLLVKLEDGIFSKVSTSCIVANDAKDFRFS
jgi:hypothetical protein